MTRPSRRRYVRRLRPVGCLLFLILAATPQTAQSQSGEVNIYSYRQPFLIAPLLDAFTQRTGIKVNVVYASSGLSERIRREGQNSPADVLLSANAGRLQQAREAGITRAVHSPVLNQAIAPAYRDAQNHWFGLTLRGRILYASRERVSQTNLDYADLADPQWRGRICIRSGQHVYNIALIASIIAHEGEEKARQWLRALKANLARKPIGNDRAQVKGVYAGECDIAIGNTYYMGKMLTNEKDPEQKRWANAVRLIFPDAAGRGTHVNISGMAMARYAPNRDNALRLMEYLVSAQAQQIYAETNFEYPIRAGVEPSAMVAGWGALRADTLPLNDLVAHRKRASRLVDEVAFDEGPGS